MGFVKDCLMSLGTGIVVGGVFAFMKLPIPAPNTIGWIGIGAMILGYWIVSKFIF